MKPLAAEVATRDQAEAMARIPGILVELSVREGDVVTRGQRIGRVVDDRLGHETRAYAAQAAAAAAESERARRELGRVRYLFERGFYARARLDEAVAAANAAAAQLEAAQELRLASAAGAGQGSIVAPTAGRVLRADVPAGAAVMAGTSVATLTSGPPLLRIQVPQALAGRLRVGAVVVVQDEELRGRSGRVVQVYPAVAGGRMTVDAEVPGLTHDSVGRRISVLLDVGARPAIAVPRRFVETRYGVDYVLLAPRGGPLARVPVQTAPTADPARLEIVSGLAPGDVLAAPAR
jgi:RND family efflux transporter MFP subunit